MNTDTEAASPRNLVVIFSGYAASSHGDTPTGTDMDGYPQLIRISRLPWIDRPSRIDRLVDRLKLRKEKKLPYEDPVEDAYAFISQNYQPGNDVVFVSQLEKIDILRPDDQKALLDAAETLAKHLYNRSRPRYLKKLQSKDESETAESSIPVHCVVVDDANVTSGPSEWNDQIKSRFPAGIRHIICCCRSESYYSAYDSSGAVASKEMCFYNSPAWPFPYATRKVYHTLDRTPQWDEQDPVWTQELASSQLSGVSDPESERPVGVYRHQIIKYDYPDGLVWRSSLC